MSSPEQITAPVAVLEQSVAPVSEKSTAPVAPPDQSIATGPRRTAPKSAEGGYRGFNGEIVMLSKPKLGRKLGPRTPAAVAPMQPPVVAPVPPRAAPASGAAAATMENLLPLATAVPATTGMGAAATTVAIGRRSAAAAAAATQYMLCSIHSAHVRT